MASTRVTQGNEVHVDYTACDWVEFPGRARICLFRGQNGYSALDKFSAAENVTLSYNEDDQLVNRGTAEGAEAIMSLLVDDWGFGVNEGDLNPDDPVVDTASEFMYQMATIGYHTLHGAQTITLDEDVEYDGELFAAGTL